MISVIKAALVVQSRDLTLAQISEAMVREPDAGYDRGSLSPVRNVPRQWASWSMELALPNGVHEGTSGLAVAIESLGEPLARQAAKLVSRGCDVVVSVHQELADGPECRGLHLTVGAIRWMSVAGASLDVDQYVDD